MGGEEGQGWTTRAVEGVEGVEGGVRGGDGNIMAEEASTVRLSASSCDGGTGDNCSCHCTGEGEKILMSEMMRISKINKINFIIASDISFDPSQKSFPITITTPILLPSPKTRIDCSIRSCLFCRCPPH